MNVNLPKENVEKKQGEKEMSLNIATINIRNSGLSSITYHNKSGSIVVSGETLPQAINNFYKQAEKDGWHICPSNTVFDIEFEYAKRFECKECKK